MVIMEANQLRVVETNGEEDKYILNSNCWPFAKQEVLVLLGVLETTLSS